MEVEAGMRGYKVTQADHVLGAGWWYEYGQAWMDEECSCGSEDLTDSLHSAMREAGEAVGAAECRMFEEGYAEHLAEMRRYEGLIGQ